MRKLTRNWIRWQMKKEGVTNINKRISRAYRDLREGKMKFRKTRKRRKAA